MYQAIKDLISETSPTSSRRAVLLFYAIIIGGIVSIGIVVLGYVICLTKVEKANSIQVLKWLIFLDFGIFVFILLLAQIITWQNINDTIQSVKGIPPGIKQELTQTVEKTTTTATAQPATQ